MFIKISQGLGALQHLNLGDAALYAVYITVHGRDRRVKMDILDDARTPGCSVLAGTELSTHVLDLVSVILSFALVVM